MTTSTTIKIKIDDEQLELLQTQLTSAVLTKISNIELNKQRYMNKKQTCIYLQLSNNTLDLWIEAGLPFIQINGTRRFDSLEIDKWVASKYNRVTTPLTRKQGSF